MDKALLSERIKAEALKLGFSACGIAQTDFLVEDALYLKRWLDEGKNGGMAYLERNREKRTDPRLLVENAQSVIVVLLNYYPSKIQDKALPQIAKYAYGKDYHTVIKDRLANLLQKINNLGLTKEIKGRLFTDSAPVLERRWAQRAGLGWIGKNCSLISPEFGSFCFIGELIVDIELEYDSAMTDKCGECSKCLEACPNKALEGAQQINANRCISYNTIESKEAIPSEFHATLSQRLYGCDICQDVCPWNKKATATKIAEFDAIPGLLELSAEEWAKMSEEEFKALLAGSAMERGGLKKIQETAVILATTNSRQRKQ